MYCEPCFSCLFQLSLWNTMSFNSKMELWLFAILGSTSKNQMIQLITCVAPVVFCCLSDRALWFFLRVWVWLRTFGSIFTSFGSSPLRWSLCADYFRRSYHFGAQFCLFSDLDGENWWALFTFGSVVFFLCAFWNSCACAGSDVNNFRQWISFTSRATFCAFDLFQEYHLRTAAVV